MRKEPKVKGLNEEYDKHALKRVGYRQKDLKSLQNYTDDIKSIVKFYVERETNSRNREKGKKLINKTYDLIIRETMIELEFKMEIMPEIMKEAHGKQANLDEEKAKEIDQKRREISREIVELTKETGEFIKSLED